MQAEVIVLDEKTSNARPRSRTSLARIDMTAAPESPGCPRGHAPGRSRRRALGGAVVAFLVAAAAASCGHVRPSQRERLAGPAMQFEMNPIAQGTQDSVLEITEGGTFPSAGPGTAGAGCGCN
jgi:Domain of unknown function (DUF4266)